MDTDSATILSALWLVKINTKRFEYSYKYLIFMELIPPKKPRSLQEFCAAPYR